MSNLDFGPDFRDIKTSLTTLSICSTCQIYTTVRKAQKARKSVKKKVNNKFVLLSPACICSDGSYGPEGSRILNNKCYMKDNVMRKWGDAGTNCNANNMTLADFVNQLDYDTIVAMMGKITIFQTDLQSHNFILT